MKDVTPVLTYLLIYLIFTDYCRVVQPRKPTRKLSSKEQSRSNDVRIDAEVPNFVLHRVDNDGTRKE